MCNFYQNKLQDMHFKKVWKTCSFNSFVSTVSEVGFEKYFLKFYIAVAKAEPILAQKTRLSK